MENPMELFLTIIQRVFSNWTALRLAVEHDMGPKDHAVEFCKYIAEVLCLNDQLTISEIATVLEDCMTDYFNTEMEDGSVVEVAEILLKFYQLCKEDKVFTVRTELEKLPPLQCWLSSQPVQQNCSVLNRANSSSSNEDMDTNEDEEGWTTVKNGRRR